MDIEFVKIQRAGATSNIRDKDSYRRGQHDSSKINVPQKTLV
jgi:hypothetical protein